MQKIVDVQNLLYRFTLKNHDNQVIEFVEFFDALDNLEPVIEMQKDSKQQHESQNEDSPGEIGISAMYVSAVIGIISRRHERADEWRIAQGMEYGGPQKQEKNHLMMAKAFCRHLYTTPSMREAFMSNMTYM